MIQRPDWFDEDLFPFESHSLEIDGSVVHYVDEGESVPLLMLHGNPTWSFLYRKLISGLSGTFRCIALDYPGFGLSTAPRGYTYTAAEHSAVVEGFVDQLGLDDIVLVVQDLGRADRSQRRHPSTGSLPGVRDREHLGLAVR
jgi:haloalkane dehalogenase